MSTGDWILAHRDRALVKLYLYTGIRLASGCSLLVEDLRQEGEEATLRLREKSDKRRTIGLHYAAAQAIHEYLQRAGLTSGPLFRPRRHSNIEELAATVMEPRPRWTILKKYLSKLPKTISENRFARPLSRMAGVWLSSQSRWTPYRWVEYVIRARTTFSSSCELVIDRSARLERCREQDFSEINLAFSSVD